MGKIPHPTQVEYVSAERVLKIEFSDDYSCELPTSFLRGFCPCARCQGHGGGPPKWNVLRTEIASDIQDVTAVGNYGMCIIWGDGHDTGIYAFEFLRALVVPEGFDPKQMKAGVPLDLSHP